MERVSPLMEVRLSDSQKEIGITNYADMAVYSDRYDCPACERTGQRVIRLRGQSSGKLPQNGYSES